MFTALLVILAWFQVIVLNQQNRQLLQLLKRLIPQLTLAHQLDNLKLIDFQRKLLVVIGNVVNQTLEHHLVFRLVYVLQNIHKLVEHVESRSHIQRLVAELLVNNSQSDQVFEANVFLETVVKSVLVKRFR